MRHSMFGLIVPGILALASACAMLGAPAAWAGVESPLIAEIEAPEGGFRIGEKIELILSTGVPATGVREESSIHLTLTASGVAGVSSPDEWTLDDIVVGETYHLGATVWISDDGEGAWRLEASSYNADGVRMWGKSDMLFVLQADDEIFQGKSSEFHLIEEKIKQDRAKGRLDERQYQREMENLQAGEELEFQKRLKGLPPEKDLPPEKIAAKVSETFVSGRITYTHRTGRDGGANQFAAAADARPLAEMLVEFYDRQGASATKLTTTPAEVRTNATGNYTNVRVPGRRADDTAVNLEVRFIFNSPAATIGTALNVVNHINAPAAPVDAANMEINYLVDNSNLDNLRRAHMHEAALFSYHETRSIITRTGTGVSPVQIPIHFPNPSGANGSYFWTVGGNHIAIGRNHAFDWDVFTHEYGHYIQELNDTARNPGGLHFIDGNLAGFDQGTQTLTKEQGIQMAWAEGWPTYFGTFLQIAGGAGEFGIYTAGDLRYTDTANNFSYDLEENASLTRARGEDVELAVQRILWDFADAPQDENDEVNFGHERMWTLLHSEPKPLTLNEFRAKMHNEIPPVGNFAYSPGTLEQNRVRYGAIYHDHGVGPAPVAPADGFTGAEPPRFLWQRKGAGNPPSYRFNLFNVQFYNKDFTEVVFTSPEIPTAAGALTDALTAEWTPTAAQWEEILGHGETLHWGVVGSHDGAPATGPYLGLTRTIGGPSIAFVIDDTGSMGPEIGGVRDGLTQFIDTLRAMEAEENPLIEVITFKDNVTHRISSRDLDEIQAVVDSLFASGGGDCPEASAQALSLAAKNVRAGGTIIFATDASPHRGYDLERVRARVLAKGIILNQIVTGDCESSSPDKSVILAGSPYKDMGDAIAAASCNPDYVPGPESEQPVEWWHDVFCLDCPEDDSMGRTMTPNILKLVGDWTLPPVSAVVAFSNLASASPKGHFLYMPEIKWGDSEPFVNAVANSALSSIVPTVLAAYPTDGAQATTMDLIIAGGSTNFRNSSLVTFSGGGITVNTASAISETELVANITIDAEAELGFRNITVTTPLGAETTEEATGTGQFRIVAASDVPQIISVVPRTIARGMTETLTFSGANTNFDQEETEILFGDGIDPQSITVISPVKAQALVTVADDAPTGFRRVTIQTGDEVLVLNNVLTLVEVLGLAEGSPEIESVSPRELPRGASNLELTVTGKSTHFVGGETTTSFSGTGISVISTTVESLTEARVHVNVALDAPLGAQNILLTTGGEVAAQSAGVVVVDPVTGEGEDVEGEDVEGEGEDGDEDKGCCARRCGRNETPAEAVKGLLGDWLLIGLSILALLSVAAWNKQQ